MCAPLTGNDVRVASVGERYLVVTNMHTTPFDSTGNYSLKEKAMLTLAHGCHDVVVKGGNFTHVSIGTECRNIKIILGINSSVTICKNCMNVTVDIFGQTAEQVERSTNWKLERPCSNISLNGKKIIE